MSDAAWLLFGGVVIGWAVRIPEVGHLRALLRESDADAKAATDRLIAAWREGYTVPSVDDEVIEEAPLHPDLIALVHSYPDPAAQAKVEAAIRRKVNAGRLVDEILMDAEVGQL